VICLPGQHDVTPQGQLDFAACTDSDNFAGSRGQAGSTSRLNGVCRARARRHGWLDISGHRDIGQSDGLASDRRFGVTKE
jgi:hypothetical protein